MTYYKTTNPRVVRQRGKINLNLALIFSLLLLSVAYLAQMNSLVGKNFELRNSQNVFKQKQEESQKLLISLMGVRSMDKIQDSAKNLELVSVDKIDYLKLSGSFAVSKQR